MSSESEVTVWDPFVRLFHWSLASGFFAAYFTEDDWMPVHIWAGYIVFALLVLRLVWGFIGPRPARFADFVKRPQTVLRYLNAVRRRQAERFLGHNPAGGAMILALIILVLVTTISGMALYGADAWLGPLAWLLKNTSEQGIESLETVHEFAAHLSVVLVAIHVFGVIWESLLHHENLVKSMFTGRKRVEAIKADIT